jgi:hypothetical protein
MGEDLGKNLGDEGDDVFQVITANRLGDGHVVYFTQKDGQTGWTTRAQSATVFAAGDIEDTLKVAMADEAANIVVGIYATEITGKNDPLGAKESIRASGGPSIRFAETRVTPKDPDYSI